MMKGKTNKCPSCDGEKHIRAKQCKTCHMKKVHSSRGIEWRKHISETKKKLFAEGKLTTWNKGLTKEDPRVLKNISGGSRKTQFKPGPRPETCGVKNNNWKGGRLIHQGYVFIRVPNHPNAVNGYVMEHRLVMEKKIGRYLTEGEVVHHKNRITTDNVIENLIVFANNSDHMKQHQKLIREERESKMIFQTREYIAWEAYSKTIQKIDDQAFHKKTKKQNKKNGGKLK